MSKLETEGIPKRMLVAEVHDLGKQIVDAEDGGVYPMYKLQVVMATGVERSRGQVTFHSGVDEFFLRLVPQQHADALRSAIDVCAMKAVREVLDQLIAGKEVL